MSKVSITVRSGSYGKGVTSTLLKLEKMFNANGIPSFYIPVHPGMDNVDTLRERCTEFMWVMHNMGFKIVIDEKYVKNALMLTYDVEPELDMDMRDLLSEFLIYITQERIPIFDIPPSFDGITL